MFKPQFLADFPVLGPVPAKAALIAAPVIIHPQMARERFPADPLLPSFERIESAFAAAMGELAPEQSIVILDRLISPSWVAKACQPENLLQTASMLVTGHCLEAEDPYFLLESWISDEGIEKSKDTLGFIVGAIYRQEEDPNPVVMLASNAWDASAYRHQVESAISIGPSLLRHQVLAPVPVDQALLNGFEGLCRMHLQFNRGAARVDADMRADGKMVLRVDGVGPATEFVVDPAVLPPLRVEELLRRLEGLSAAPFPMLTHADSASPVVH